MQTQVPASGLPFPTAPEVIFTDWREALHRSGLTPSMQAVYTLAVSGYLEYCSRNALKKGSNRRLEFQLCAGCAGPRGLALVLSTARAMEHQLSPSGRANSHPRRNPLDRQR
jgi:hypothetical protein